MRYLLFFSLFFTCTVAVPLPTESSIIRDFFCKKKKEEKLCPPIEAEIKTLVKNLYANNCKEVLFFGHSKGLFKGSIECGKLIFTHILINVECFPEKMRNVLKLEDSAYSLSFLLWRLYQSSLLELYDKKKGQCSMNVNHLRWIKNVIRSSSNIGYFYHYDKDFAQKFTQETGALYQKHIWVQPKLGKAPWEHKSENVKSHLNTLGAIRYWLDKNSTKRLPHDISKIILLFTFGKGFSHVHKQLATIGMHIFDTSYTCIKPTMSIYMAESLKHLYIPHYALPYSYIKIYPSNHKGKLPISKTTHAYDIIHYYKLYDIFVHLSNTPYPILVQAEGWGEEHIIHLYDVIQDEIKMHNREEEKSTIYSIEALIYICLLISKTLL